MNLIYENYEAKGNGDRFDLYINTKVVAKKDSDDHKEGDEYIKRSLIGYGYTYSSLVTRIAQEILVRMDVKIDLRVYVTKFDDVVEKIVSLLKTVADETLPKKEESTDS